MKINIRRFLPRNPRKGQSLVELALSLMFLLILLTGISDVGRMVFYYLSMRDAVQEGAAYASIYPKHCTQIVERVWSAMGDNSVQVFVTVDGTTTCAAASETTQACSGHTIQIQAIQPHFNLATPIIGTFIGGQSIRLQAQITGTILRPPCE